MIAELLILLPLALEKVGGNRYQKPFGRDKTPKMRDDMNLQEPDSTAFGGLEFKKYF